MVQTSQVEFSLFSLLLVQGNGVVVPKKRNFRCKKENRGAKSKAYNYQEVT